jgi:hypothetical protein
MSIYFLAFGTLFLFNVDTKNIYIKQEKKAKEKGAQGLRSRP